MVGGLIEVFESSHHISHLSHRIFVKIRHWQIKIETKSFVVGELSKSPKASVEIENGMAYVANNLGLSA